MPDRTFEIKITTPADLTGAQATQAALDAVADKATKLATSADGAGVSTDRITEAAGRLQEGSRRFAEMGQSVDQVRRHLSDTEHEADHLFSTLKAGIGIDLGHRLVEGIAEVPAKFREIIEDGVRYNAQVETFKLSLAGAFRAADPDTYTSFQAAEVAGSHALDAIREKANELGLSFEGMAHGLSINLKGLEEGGITDIKQQIDLIATLNQAAQAKGLEGFQANRDITDLLNGRANRTMFGVELGIDDKDVKAAREAGKLYEFLNEKLAAYKEGGQAAAQTFAAAEQRMKNETEALYGEISKPVFGVLKDALNEINSLLKNETIANELRGLGYDVAELVKDGAMLLKWGIELAPILFRVAEGIGAVSLGIALLKLPGIISSLGKKSLAWLENAKAIDTESGALRRNTAEAERNALAKKGVPGGGGVAGAAEEGAGGAGKRTFLGKDQNIGNAIGYGMVALEAGVGLIQLWESHELELQDAITARSNAESDSLITMQKQIDAAKSAKDQEQARVDLKKKIADLDAQIAANEEHGFVPDGAGGGINFDDDPDATMLLRNQRGLYQHQLDTFDSHAGAGQEDKNKAKRDKEVLDKYHATDEYKSEQAELAGDQEGMDAYGFQKEVAKIKKRLMETEHLPDALAQTEAEAQALANDLGKQRKGLNAGFERLERETEKTKDAATIKADLDAKMRELTSALPANLQGAATAGDLGAVRAGVEALPTDTPHHEQEEITQKEKLRDLLQQIIVLRRDDEAAQRQADAAQKKVDDDAKSAAAAKKTHDDSLASEREEIAILRARAEGNEAEARQLEHKRDVQREITRLMGENLSYAEAQPIAEDRVKLQEDAKDAKKDDSDHRRREPTREHDEHKGITIQGYRARFGDAGFAGVGGGVGESTASRALSKMTGDPEHDPAARLAAMPSAIEAADARRARADRPNLLAPFFAGGPLASLFGAPTAASSLAPTMDRLAGASAGGMLPGLGAPLPGPSGGDGLLFAGQGAYQAGVSALGAAKGAMTAAGKGKQSDEGAAKLKELEGKFRELETQLKRVADQANMLEGWGRNQA